MSLMSVIMSMIINEGDDNWLVVAVKMMIMMMMLMTMMIVRGMLIVRRGSL